MKHNTVSILLSLNYSILISYLFHVIEDVNITCVYVVDVYQHKNCEQWSRVVFELVQSVTCYTAKYCMLFAVCVL